VQDLNPASRLHKISEACCASDFSVLFLDNFSELFVAQDSLETLDAVHYSWKILDVVRLRRRRKFR
jgi:hypothetical protein